jgi:hypothetical protein
MPSREGDKNPGGHLCAELLKFQISDCRLQIEENDHTKEEYLYFYFPPATPFANVSRPCFQSDVH